MKLMSSDLHVIAVDHLECIHGILISAHGNKSS
jgi:hypothetical protein